MHPPTPDPTALRPCDTAQPDRTAPACADARAPGRAPWRRWAAGLGVVAATVALACGGGDPGAATEAAQDETSDSVAQSADSAATPDLDRHVPPAEPGALAPQLSPARQGGVWLSWLEPTGDEGHRLRLARFTGSAWEDAHTVAEGDDFFANWADVPSVVESAVAGAPDGQAGELLAHWLAKTGDDTYAYGVFLARSDDGGATWNALGTLHDDTSPTEHGFASLVPATDGGFDAVWLDGRAMADGGAMALRGAHVPAGAASRDAIRPAGNLDERVCECCQTGAARTGDGLLAAYRDRSESEIRDISLVRHGTEGDTWTAPAPLHDDGWNIAGCPVNGPAVAARGDDAFVAWFTAADSEPRVRLAASRDGGATFGAAREIDAEGAGPVPDAPMGRVDLAVVPADPPVAVVSWLGGDGGVWLRRVPADGPPAAAVRVARTATARASGFPRVETYTDADRGQRLAVTWVEPGGGDEGTGDGLASLRFATLAVDDLP